MLKKNYRLIEKTLATPTKQQTTGILVIGFYRKHGNRHNDYPL